MQDSGKPGTSSGGAAGRVKNSGKPGDSLGRHRRRMRDSRKLEDPSPAQPEDAGFGETRNLIRRRCWRSEDSGKPGDLIASTAEGCGIRGNSKIHRRHSQEMQEAR
jgi:hypothetical protein